MSIGSILRALVESDKKGDDSTTTNKKNELGKSMFSSKRLWIVVGFGCLLFYVTGGIFSGDNLKVLAAIAIIYILGESATEIARIIMNGLIKREEIKGIFADGKIDEEEAKLLENDILTKDKKDT